MLEQKVVDAVKKYQVYSWYGGKLKVIEGEFLRKEGSVRIINRNLKLQSADFRIGPHVYSFYIAV